MSTNFNSLECANKCSRVGEDYQATISPVTRGVEDQPSPIMIIEKNSESQKKEIFLAKLKKVYGKISPREAFDALAILSKCKFDIDLALFLFFCPGVEPELVDRNAFERFGVSISGLLDVKVVKQRIESQLQLTDLLTKKNHVSLKDFLSISYDLVDQKNLPLNVEKELATLINDIEEAQQKIKVMDKKFFYEAGKKLLEEFSNRYPFIKEDFLRDLRRALEIFNTLDFRTSEIKTDLLDHISFVENSIVPESVQIVMEELGFLLKDIEFAEKTLKKEGIEKTKSNLQALRTILQLYSLKLDEKSNYIDEEELENLKNNDVVFSYLPPEVKREFLCDYKNSTNITNKVFSLIKLKKTKEAANAAQMCSNLRFHSVNLDLLQYKLDKEDFITKAQQILENAAKETKEEAVLDDLLNGSTEFIDKESDLYRKLVEEKTKCRVFGEKIQRQTSVSIPISAHIKIINEIKSKKFQPYNLMNQMKEVQAKVFKKVNLIQKLLSYKESSFEYWEKTFNFSTDFVNIFNLTQEDKVQPYGKLISEFSERYSQISEKILAFRDIINAKIINEKEIQKLLASIENDKRLKSINFAEKETCRELLKASRESALVFTELATQIKNQKEINYSDLKETIQKCKVFDSILKIESFEVFSSKLDAAENWLRSISEKNAYLGIIIKENYGLDFELSNNLKLEILGLKQMLEEKPESLKNIKFYALEEKVNYITNLYEDLLKEQKRFLDKNSKNKDPILESLIKKFNELEKIGVFSSNLFDSKHSTLWLTKNVAELFQNKPISLSETLCKLIKLLNTNSPFVESLKTTNLFNEFVSEANSALLWVEKTCCFFEQFYKDATPFVLGMEYDLGLNPRLLSVLKVEKSVLGNIITKPVKKNHEQEFYCYCRLPHSAVLEMIKCDNCLDWYHFECSLLFKSDFKDESEDFICLECSVEQGIKFKHLEHVLWSIDSGKPQNFGLNRRKPRPDRVVELLNDSLLRKVNNIKLEEADRLRTMLDSVLKWNEHTNAFLEEKEFDGILLLQKALSHACRGRALLVRPPRLGRLMRKIVTQLAEKCVSGLFIAKPELLKGAVLEEREKEDFEDLFKFLLKRNKQVSFDDLSLIYNCLHCEEREKKHFVEHFGALYKELSELDAAVREVISNETDFSSAENRVSEVAKYSAVSFSSVKAVRTLLVRAQKWSERTLAAVRDPSVSFSKLLLLESEYEREIKTLVTPALKILEKEKEQSLKWQKRLTEAFSRPKLNELEALLGELKKKERPIVDFKDVERLKKAIAKLQAGFQLEESVKKIKTYQPRHFKFVKEENCFLKVIWSAIKDKLKEKMGNNDYLGVKDFVLRLQIRMPVMSEASAMRDVDLAKTINLISSYLEWEDIKEEVAEAIKKLFNKKLISSEECKFLLICKGQIRNLLVNAFVRLEKMCKHSK